MGAQPVWVAGACPVTRDIEEILRGEGQAGEGTTNGTGDPEDPMRDERAIAVAHGLLSQRTHHCTSKRQPPVKNSFSWPCIVILKSQPSTTSSAPPRTPI